MKKRNWIILILLITGIVWLLYQDYWTPGNVADISLEQKTILAFGTESSGASDELLEYADELVSIPMFGFTESFNISVSVAICLYELTLRLHASDLNWRFSDGQKLDTKITWLKNILKDPRKYSQYLKDKGFLI